MNNVSLETIVSLAKRRGFVFPGSDIYGGLAGTYDYGPHGVALRNNLKQIWWRRFVETRDDMYGVDAAILMNPKAWVASGHVGGFSDPQVECTNCNNRQRTDHLLENDRNYWLFLKAVGEAIDSALITERGTSSKLSEALTNLKSKESLSEKAIDDGLRKARELAGKLAGFDIMTQVATDEIVNATKYFGKYTQEYLNAFITCPSCEAKSKWGLPRQFNMMFKTSIGATEDESSITYLRPETAGGMFVNFKNIVDAYHPKLPFGMGQIGKAFRNEIAPREFVFRLRELEQMEVEYFVRPQEWEAAFDSWKEVMTAYANEIGLSMERFHPTEIQAEDLAHYSKRTIDFEYEYPFGRRELWGLAYRTDFDLKAHMEASGVSLEYLDEEVKKKLVPHVIEPSLGVDRTFLAVLAAAYDEDELGGEKRVVLRFNPKVAPVKAMVSPLLKNKPELVEKAREVRKALQKIHPAIAWDDNGNIGKRYRRQDEIGTPWCVTIDFDTLGETEELKDTVTVRNRDTGEQERMSLVEVEALLSEALV